MATVQIYPTVDKTVCRDGVNEDFATIRAGAGNNLYNNTTDYTDFWASSTSSKYQALWRGVLVFDTTSLSGHTVNSASIKLRGYDKDNEFAAVPSLTITSGTTTDPAAIVAADYENFGDTEYTSRVGYNDFSTEGYNTFTLNEAGLAALNDSGYTVFFVRLSWDTDNGAPTWGSGYDSYMYWRSVDYTGTDQDPYLEVTYDEATPTSLIVKYDILKTEFIAKYDILKTELTAVYQIQQAATLIAPYTICASTPIIAKYDILLATSLISNYDIRKEVHFDNRRQITYYSGSTSPSVGDTVTGDTSGATGTVVAVTLTSGTWAGGDAEGSMYLTNVTGQFIAGEELNLTAGA